MAITVSVMPHGQNCAPEMFHDTIDHIFAELPNVYPYFDDILISSLNKEEHCQQHRNVLGVACKANLKLNREKLQISFKGEIPQAPNPSGKGPPDP